MTNKEAQDSLVDQGILDAWRAAADNSIPGPDHAEESPARASELLRATVKVLASRRWPEPVEVAMIAYCRELAALVTPYRRINVIAGVYDPKSRRWDETSVTTSEIASHWLTIFQDAEVYGIHGLPAFDAAPTGAKIRVQARPQDTSVEGLVLAEHVATMSGGG